MLRKKVKLLLEQLQVCIFAEIVFGVRCTLITAISSGVTALLKRIYCIINLKFSDNQTYVKVLTRLQILEPLEVCSELSVPNVVYVFIHAGYHLVRLTKFNGAR